MPLQVTSDNLDITPSMKALAETKLSRLTQKLNHIPEDALSLRVVLNKGNAEGTFEAKISFRFSGKTIVGEDYEYSLESALIKAVDDALRQYQKEKSKRDSENWEKRREMKAFHYDGDE